MKTTRKKIIQDKVFIKENIKSLWNLVRKENDESKKNANHSSLELEIKCVDGISYESETDDLLQDGDVIDTKRCTSVSIEYHDFKQERRISLNLSHGNTYDTYGSNLLVRGDKNWVSGTFESLDSVIESVKPQEHWFVKYKTLILHVGAFLLGLIIYELLYLIWYQYTKPIENLSENIKAIRDFINKTPFILYVVNGILFWAQGIIPILWLRDWVLKLWPSIEFDFGPEHKKTEKMRRKRLGLFFSIIIVPLIINLIYDLFTK